MKTIMKYAIIILVALFAQSFTNKEADNDWTRDKLHGKVHSFSEVSYKAEDRFGNIEKGKRERGAFRGKDEQRKYDDKGNLIEMNTYNSDGSLYRKGTYKHDDKGNQIEMNTYFDGKKETNKYDDKGNLIEMNTYNSDGSLLAKFTYKYKFDKQGNQIEMNSYNLDGSLFIKETYKYDDKGNQIEKNIYFDGSLISKETYKYDDKRNQIEENKYNSDGSLYRKWTFKYEYDQQGNWIKRIVFIDEIPKYILEREFEYYK